MTAPEEIRDQADVLWEIDIVGKALVNADGTIKRANPAFLSIIGYSAAQLEGMHFRDITHPQDVNADEEMVRRVLTGEEHSYVMRKRYLTRTGGIVWIKLVVHPFTRVGEDGKVERYMLYAQVAPIEFGPDNANSGAAANTWTTRDVIRSKQRTELLDWLKWVFGATVGVALVMVGALRDPSDATLISIGATVLAASGLGAGTERVLKRK